MIGTHTTKLVNPKAQQSALCADIITDIPKHFVTSKSTQLTKKYYACPANAGDMKHWREQSRLANTGEIKPSTHLPEIEDSRAVKQLLVARSGWQQDRYFNVSPLESMGLLHEVWLRSKSMGVWTESFSLESVPAGYSNHGELLLDQSGKVALLKRTCKTNQRQGKSVERALQLTCDVQDMNVSSGYLAYGQPAITAIGGLVHRLERDTNQDISFAIGLQNLQLNSLRLGTNYQRMSKRTPKKTLSTPKINYELTASGSIVLLFKADNINAITHSLKKIDRIAGGSIFNPKIKVLDNQPPAIASYLASAVDEVRINEDVPAFKDALAHGMFMYQYPINVYSLNQNGYALLELPQTRPNARNTNYQHAWCEPIYSLIKQTSFKKSCWWTRQNKGGYVYWG